MHYNEKFKHINHLLDTGLAVSVSALLIVLAAPATMLSPCCVA